VSCGIVGALAPAARGQTPLPWPVEQMRASTLDSTPLGNETDGPRTVFETLLEVPGAAWVRLFFGEVELGPGSVIRLTALKDGEVQELDRVELRRWRFSSVYFNGEAVRLALVAGPHTDGNRVSLHHVTFQLHDREADGTCGICGPDDRMPSSEDWACRLLPAGCSASIVNDISGVITAGHCVDGMSDVVQFRVPPSNPDCTLNHPSAADQFPITESMFENGGVGRDWGVMLAGDNVQGQTPFDRYGVFRPVATNSAAVNDPILVWGYGIDDECTRSRTQQHSGGTVNGVSTLFLTHDADATFGNSGSPIVRGTEILGVATHCDCPTNIATSVNNPEFFTARMLLFEPPIPGACCFPGGACIELSQAECEAAFGVYQGANTTCAATTCEAPCPADINEDGVVDVLDLLELLSAWGPCPGCPADINEDGVVDVLDLLELLLAWGPCP
jgi:V8-like Glu-specific endopeptidase